MQRSVACGIFLQVLALSVTFSRAALFSWIGASALFFLLLFFRQEKEKSVPLQRAWVGLIGVILLSLLVSFVFFGEQFFHRGGVFQYNELAKSSDATRWAAQDAALVLIKNHPFFGVGLENFMKASNAISGGKLAHMAHNCYLLIAAEMGLVALFCFFGFLFSQFLRIKKESLSLEASLLLASFAGFLAIALFDFYPLFLQGGMIPFFVLSALFTTALDLQKGAAGIREKELLSRPCDRSA